MAILLDKNSNDAYQRIVQYEKDLQAINQVLGIYTITNISDVFLLVESPEKFALLKITGKTDFFISGVETSPQKALTLFEIPEDLEQVLAIMNNIQYKGRIEWLIDNFDSSDFELKNNHFGLTEKAKKTIRENCMIYTKSKEQEKEYKLLMQIIELLHQTNHATRSGGYHRLEYALEEMFVIGSNAKNRVTLKPRKEYILNIK